MIEQPTFRLAAIADTHLGPPCAIPERKSELALSLLEQAVTQFNGSLEPDVVVFLGDVVDDGRREETQNELLRVRETLETLHCPFLVVPGNHDRDAPGFADIFGPFPKRLDIEPVSILAFEDHYAEGDYARRADEDIAWLLEQAETLMPLRIVIQHTPLYPDIEDTYPYNLQNRRTVSRAYRRTEMRLSLSGHYHPGIDPIRHEGIWYAILPALCEAPFAFAWAEVRGDRVSWHRQPCGGGGVR